MNRNWQVPEFEVDVLRKKRTKYCICIPVINEGDRIQKQLTRMNKYAKLADIIIIDGGSIDNSVKSDFIKKKGVSAKITTSVGQAKQYRAGFAWSLERGYEGIITIDGNNKDGVSAIPNFIKALNDGYDYVQGSRYMAGGVHKNTPLHRSLGARLIISPILSLGARKWYSETTSAFRGYSKRYLLHPKVRPFRNIFTSYDLLFYLVIRANTLGLRTKEIPVTRNYPKGKIPTKIAGIKILDLVFTAIKTSIGIYNPKF